MENQGKNWRLHLKRTHCGAEILPDGKDIECIIIDHIEYLNNIEVDGKKKEDAIVCYFKQPNPYTDMPMLVNVTNSRILTKLNKGDNKLDLIKNFPVRLTREWCYNPKLNEKDWALRFSSIPAKVVEGKEVLTNTHPKWQNNVDFLKNGGAMSTVKDKYEVSAEVEKILTEKGE